MKIYKKIVVIILLVFIFDAQASLKNIFNKLSVFNKKNKQQVGHVFDNFYSVEDGVFYRAQQLSKSDLDKYIKQFSIKTVINLRGNKDARWWQKEKAVSEYNGALFFSLDMSAIYLTTKASLIRLLTIYQDAPRPILVHCIGGADRTGEASALWILDQQKKGKEDALKQLSIKYGHRKYKNSAKDFLIEIWQGKEWAFNSYDHRNYPTQCKPEDLH